jgi:predicted Rossmann fold flavoprotein
VYDAIVVGGGAAGFFAALNLAELAPGSTIRILEKTNKLLSKVAVSGGGRCNVTHHCFDNRTLSENYPRGRRELLQVFSRFNVEDTIQWFGQHNVRLKTEADNRMFPVTDNSQTIIDCFIQSAKLHRIEISTSCEVYGVNKVEGVFQLNTACGQLKTNNLIIASGGSHKLSGYEVIQKLGHHIIAPIPSLFTFNLPDERIRKQLQGVAADQVIVSIGDGKSSFSGPVLVTHWGLSGPAVLKLSAFAAEYLHEKNYVCDVVVNWAGLAKAGAVIRELERTKNERSRANPYNTPLFSLPRRLWEFLCAEAALSTEKNWSETSKAEMRRLEEQLCNSVYKMRGKTTFKEEFVSCGGIDTREVNFRTMESRLSPGLYFCGEVLNIDGITGGFNFQSAWSTGYICALSVSDKINTQKLSP